MQKQEIPVVSLATQIQAKPQIYSRSIMEGEVNGIDVEHVAITNQNEISDSSKDGHRTIYLFVKGSGDVTADKTKYEIVPETIFLPNAIDNIRITPANGDSLHYLKISCKLSAQDCLDLQELPIQKTQSVYCAKFADCESYSEAIKSPDTISRTILSNEYIPRVAMGTVKAKGPDKVAAHEHPMLEQLFLGLSENSSTVYADDAQVDFPEYSLLHIPLGSSHSISVEKDKIMYYVWMDFFLDKKGEEWLKTHNADTNQR